MRDFENRDIVKILGVNSRTLIDWSQIGLVTPTVEASGTGTRRRYSERNLVELAIVQRLLEDGIKRDIVKAIALGFFDAAASDDPLSLHDARANTETLYLLINLETRSARWGTIAHTEAAQRKSLTKQITDYNATLRKLTDNLRMNEEKSLKVIRLMTERSLLESELLGLTKLGDTVLELNRVYVLNISRLKHDIRARSQA